jgi:hypothetical protein
VSDRLVERAALARGRRFIDEARATELDTGKSAGYAVVLIITGSTVKAAQWANARSRTESTCS